MQVDQNDPPAQNVDSEEQVEPENDTDTDDSENNPIE